MSAPMRNILVVGASYVGLVSGSSSNDWDKMNDHGAQRTAQELARIAPSTHRPRFAVLSGHEHKAFVPFEGVFASTPRSSTHHVIRGEVLSVHPHSIRLDRSWQGSNEIDFDFLAIATGYLRLHQAQIRRSNSVIVVGAGAVGVQIAGDVKELYPEKEVTVIQSRDRTMPKFHPRLHEAVEKRFQQLDIRLITGVRVKVPLEGFPKDRRTFQVRLTNGQSLSADCVIQATGQRPNNHMLTPLCSDSPSSDGNPLINPLNGYIRVKPTMQIADDHYPHIFVVGDVADTEAAKAARPGYAQAEVAAKNISALLQGRPPAEELKYNVKFRNPDPTRCGADPSFSEEVDGREDLNVESMWNRLNVPVQVEEQYNL